MRHRIHEIASVVLADYGRGHQAPFFQASALGLCLLALADNARAERLAAYLPQREAYANKAALLAEALRLSPDTTWWIARHSRGRHGKFALFIEPIEGVQFSYHLSALGALRLLIAARRWPQRAEGRRWSRKPLKPHAARLIEAFVSGDEIAIVNLVHEIPHI